MNKALLYFSFCMAFVSCVKRDKCPDFTSNLISDKPAYKQYEPVHLKLLYTDRASYEWTVGGKIQAETGSELYFKTASLITDGVVKCTAKVGQCVTSEVLKIPISVEPVPSCIIQQNSLTLNATSIGFSDGKYNKNTFTFSGKIGNTSNQDSIVIAMPFNFDEIYPISIFNIFVSPTKVKVNIILKLGVSTYSTDGNAYKLLYTRQGNLATILCCNLKLQNASAPFDILNGNFNFEILL